jgi:hypothetical protein
MDLLHAVAVEDAPAGLAFTHAERVLREVNDANGRDALYLAALRAAQDDFVRVVLLEKRLAFLESLGPTG